MNLKIGERFPDVELPDQDGQQVKLRSCRKISVHPIFLPRLLVRKVPGAVAPLC
jgi:peroxiredoxin